MRSRPSSSKVAPASRRSHAGRNPQSINRHNEFRSFAFAVRVRVYLDLHMKTRFVVQLATVLFLLFVPSVVRADTLDDLARDFWAWRAAEQPVSSDDIPRIEPPSGWVSGWSPEAVARYHKQLDEYETRWQKIDASAGPIPRQVDYRLMGRRFLACAGNWIASGTGNAIPVFTSSKLWEHISNFCSRRRHLIPPEASKLSQRSLRFRARWPPPTKTSPNLQPRSPASRFRSCKTFGQGC